MSVTREEDRQKNTCPSRGLGIAAAAIGVGVGAALYYFFNKRTEHPNSEGSTSDWNCERPETFILTSDDSYTTISEHETTDTSIIDSNSETNDQIVITDSDSYDQDNESFNNIIISDTESDFEMSDDDELSDTEFDIDISDMSDSDISDFDVTTSSIGIPEDSDRSRSPGLFFGTTNWLISPSFNVRRPRTQLTEEEQMAMIRQEQFRERSWTLEECSICFDVMLRNQEVTRLPCAHNFHTECILPWLQEKQTCPNCRKAAE